MLRLGCLLFVVLALVVFTINLPMCGIPIILALAIFAILKAAS
jgi:hypothetical protein